MKKILAAALLIWLPAEPASLLSIQKTPYEAFNCSIDFTQVIGADGLTINAVVSTDLNSGADTTATVIAASPAPAIQGDTVIFRVQGGANGQSHLVGVRVTDNVTGEQFEGQITVKIYSGTNR